MFTRSYLILSIRTILVKIKKNKFLCLFVVKYKLVRCKKLKKNIFKPVHLNKYVI